MERRLVKQGRNALTVTLPAKWLKTKGLQAGNTVHIEPGNEQLTIKTRPTSEQRTITIDVKNEEKSMIWHTVIGRYIEGYDKITILHNNPQLTQQLTKELIGMVIEEHTKTKTVLTSIVSIPEKTIEPLMRRVLHMLGQLSEQLIDVAEKKMTAKAYKEQERILDTTIMYSLRYLTKYETHEHAYKYFLLLTTIEAAADQLSIIAKFIDNNKQLAEHIQKNVALYVQYMGKRDLKKLYTSLRNFRNSLDTNNFVEGLTYALSEQLYNNIGYFLT